MDEPTTPGRKLGLFDATMLVMGGIIGVGIFISPKDVAELVPSQLPFLGMWLLGGAVAMCGAATFAELGGTFPRTGGWFEFLREIYGPFISFLFAWVILGVVATGAIAVIAGFGAQMIGGLIPALHGEGRELVVAAAIILGITGIVLCGIKVGATFQNLCMIIKLLAIAALVVAGLFFFTPGEASLPIEGAAPVVPLSFAGELTWKGFIGAFLPVFFAFGGWQHLCYIAADVVEPRRTLPKAILIGVACVAVTYFLANFAYVRVLGIDQLATTDGFAAVVAQRTLGGGGERALRAAMAVSAVGVCVVNIIVTPGIFVGMARNGLFFERFGRLHPTTGAPVLALLAQAAIALGYLFWSHADVFVDLGERVFDPADLTAAVVFAEWMFHFLIAFGLIKLRLSRPDLPRPYKSFLYPLAPAIYLLVASLILVGNLATGPLARSGVGLVVLGIGALVYKPWRSFLGRPDAPRG